MPSEAQIERAMRERGGSEGEIEAETDRHADDAIQEAKESPADREDQRG